ncbi:MAG: hypothetical protein AB2A00_38165 [Myxococcota bacterium]
MGRKASSEKRGTMVFETRDDHLAAYLVLRGCRRTGLVAVEGKVPRVLHVFDDDALRLMAVVESYRRGEGDGIPALLFAQTALHLRAIRRDERLRLRRRAPSAPR